MLDNIEAAALEKVLFQDVTKRFPGVLANDRVTLQIRRGEVLGLVGENGAGKTTLMNILYGLYQPDEGQIYVDGLPVEIRSPSDAIDHGIGMVHQHFMLVRPFTVTENLVLGLRDGRGPFLDLKQAQRKVEDLAAGLGIQVDPQARIWQLSVGEQQRVEILNALLRHVDLLILDEPTAVLTPQETEALFTILRRLTGQGKSVVFITHKLQEAIAATDRISVLRHGVVVDTVPTVEVSERQLASMMVGREVLFSYERKPGNGSGELLSVQDLKVRGDRNLLAVDGVNLTVKSGEILGIAGVDGNGQTELCEALAGMRPIEAGTVKINGRPFERLDPLTVAAQGVGYIPADRHHTALVLDMPVWANAVLKRFGENQFCRNLLLRRKSIHAFSSKLIEEYDIRVSGPKVMARGMSGGNQQKLVLARELSTDPEVLIADQPTRGLDVGAIEYVHERLLEQRARGKGVLLVSRELEEIFSLSDRIAVMYEGRIVEVVSSENADRELIGELMAGVTHLAGND